MLSRNTGSNPRGKYVSFSPNYDKEKERRQK